jgi:GT2 family glycosyltransferase
VTQLSIVIPVYNNWWMTARVLRALDALRDASATSFETIVVDNASADETQASMSAFPWVRYERMETNTNFAGACNAGAHLATAPLVLFLNNDAYPLGDALTPLVRAFDREEVAIAGGALFFEDGATQGAGFVVLPNAHWHYFCRNLSPALDDVTQSRDALGVSGAAMAVRTAWFRKGGGFDESYINGFEDVDLCMRARMSERAIRYVADARFAHYEGASAGRFDRESENERHFYDRWSAGLSGMPRTARGSVGAISVRALSGASALSLAALEDLEGGLRSFGHPLLRGAIRPWHRVDRRFRDGASLAWFTGDAESPGVTIERPAGENARIRTHGAAGMHVPWLPCAAVERVDALPLRQGNDASCATVAIAGFDAIEPERCAETLAAFEALAARIPEFRLLAIAPGNAEELVHRFGERVRIVSALVSDTPVDVACVLHAGLTDESAFGNVLLAQARVATVALASKDLQGLFASDVVAVSKSGEIAGDLAKFVLDPAARIRSAASSSSDARRRFSPRRSAIRVVDLLCAAAFGPERAAPARSDTPL